MEDKKTSSLQVAKPTTDKRMHSLPLDNEILHAAEIRMKRARANVRIDPCTVGADLISARFCNPHNIGTEEMTAKSLFTENKGSKSTITKKSSIEVDVQGYKEIRTFLLSNLMHRDAIIGHPMLHHLNTVMRIKDVRVRIHPAGKMRYDFNMHDRVTETPVMQAAATYTEDDDTPCDSPISYYALSHALETETDDDTTDSSSDYEEEPALSHYTSDNDSQARPEEQGYLMLDETTTLHPWLDWDSPEEIIAQALPHWSYYTDIDDSEIAENDTEYDNVVPSREVEPDTILTDAFATRHMYDPIAGFPEC